MNYLERKYLELDQKTELVAREIEECRRRIKLEAWYINTYGCSDAEAGYVGWLSKDFRKAKDKMEKLAEEQKRLDEMRKEWVA